VQWIGEAARFGHVLIATKIAWENTITPAYQCVNQPYMLAASLVVQCCCLCLCFASLAAGRCSCASSQEEAHD
jgi:hypothetical protein